MKTTYRLLSLSLILGFFSCEKNEDVSQNENVLQSENTIMNKTSYENATQIEKEEYVKFHLLKVAKFLDKEYTNASIKSSITSKGAIIDQEQSLLVEKLLAPSEISKSASTNTNDLKELKKSLTAFDGLEGNDWKIAVTAIQGSRAGTNRIIDETKPIFVLSVDTEKGSNGDEIDGYQLNSLDVMEKLDEKVTVQTLDDYTVFKVGVVDGPEEVESGGGYSGGTGDNITNPDLTLIGSGNTITTSTPGLKIQNILIKDKKETVFEKGDIHFAGFKNTPFPQYSGDGGEYMTSSSNFYTTEGKRMTQVGNSGLHQTKLLNFILDTAITSTATNTKVVYYVIFEHDNLPAPTRIATFNLPNGQTYNVLYNSYEADYHRVQLKTFQGNINNTVINLPYAFGYSYDGAWITYNLANN